MESKKILIAPFSARLHTGAPNAKNPPIYWWEEVIAKLIQNGFEVTQIGLNGEERLKGVSQHLINWPLKALVLLANEHDAWLSVDSFWPHLCWAFKLKSGVVIWSQSDPRIFGHDCNVNLLKDRKYLREFQYQSWTVNVTYNEDAFVSPEEVVNACIASLNPSDRTTSISPSLRMAEVSPTRPSSL